MMKPNVGNLDRIARVVVGVVLLAYALKVGFPNTGWNWVGLVGVVPILTAVFRVCPAYGVLGIKTDA